jgi:hypothetical protein
MKRWILGAVLAIGCNNAPSEDQCKQLLDHLIDLELKKAGTGAAGDTTKAEIAKQKAAVMQVKSADFVDACTKRTARGRIECALGAPDLDALARCDDAAK